MRSRAVLGPEGRWARRWLRAALGAPAAPGPAALGATGLFLHFYFARSFPPLRKKKKKKTRKKKRRRRRGGISHFASDGISK